MSNALSKRLAAVVVALAPIVVIYLSSAFVFLTLNPAEWTEAARLFTAVLGLMLSFIFSAAFWELT